MSKMKKKDIVALSALVLVSVATVTTASANADEKKPALDDSAVVQVDKPTTPPAADTKPAPAEPAKDISGDKQPEKPVTPPSDDKGVVPVEPAKPSEDGKKDDGNKDSSENPKPAEPSQPSSDDKGTAPVSDDNIKPAPNPTPNPSTKPSEPTIPVTPTVENPVVTNTGASIVSTQNGQLVLSDGSRVAPEALGAKTNSDKTISVTKADGTTITLPETGEAQNVLGLLGSALLGVTAWFFRKKQA
jgi:LPXTG-motif cell wall-anchored protein